MCEERHVWSIAHNRMCFFESKAFAFFRSVFCFLPLCRQSGKNSDSKQTVNFKLLDLGSHVYIPRPVKSAPPVQHKKINVDSRPTTGTVKSLQAMHSGIYINNGPMTMSIQEQCGINMGFPGRTEYMDR